MANIYPRFVNSILPYDSYLEFYLHGKFKTFKGRRVLRIGNLFIPWSRVMWALSHPDETLLPTDDVHHKNEDKTDDRLDNLERCSHRGHMRMHHNVMKQRRSDIAELLSLRKKEIQNNFSRLPRRTRDWFSQRALNQMA